MRDRWKESTGGFPSASGDRRSLDENVRNIKQNIEKMLGLKERSK